MDKIRALCSHRKNNNLWVLKKHRIHKQKNTEKSLNHCFGCISKLPKPLRRLKCQERHSWGFTDSMGKAFLCGMAEDADRKMIQKRNIVLGATKCEACLSRCSAYERMGAVGRSAKTARCAPGHRLSLWEAGPLMKLRGPREAVYGVLGMTMDVNQNQRNPQPRNSSQA